LLPLLRPGRQARQQPFDEYWRVSIDVGIEQRLVSGVFLMPMSFAEPRFVDNQSDAPRAMPAHSEEESKLPISEFATSRTCYCAGLARLLGRDVHNLMERQISQNLYLTAETFLNDPTESLGLSETTDVKSQLFG
jgi:hypothetical protein